MVSTQHRFYALCLVHAHGLDLPRGLFVQERPVPLIVPLTFLLAYWHCALATYQTTCTTAWQGA